MAELLYQLILTIVLSGTIPPQANEIFNVDCLEKKIPVCGTLVVKDINNLTPKEGKVVFCRSEAALSCVKEDGKTAYANAE